MANDVGDRLAQRHCQDRAGVARGGLRVAVNRSRNAGHVKRDHRGAELVRQAAAGLARERLAHLTQSFAASIRDGAHLRLCR